MKISWKNLTKSFDRTPEDQQVSITLKWGQYKLCHRPHNLEKYILRICNEIFTLNADFINNFIGRICIFLYKNNQDAVEISETKMDQKFCYFISDYKALLNFIKKVKIVITFLML